MSHWLIKNLDSVYTKISLRGADFSSTAQQSKNDESDAAHTRHVAHKLRIARDFVTAQALDGHEVVILIDDAHALEPAMLDEFRSMLDDESLAGRVSVVLLGLPVLHERLSPLDLNDQDGQVFVVYSLARPEKVDVASLIEDRMASADYAIAFPELTIKLIEHYCGGKLALANTLCTFVPPENS